MDKALKSVIIITGASRGIGKFLFEKFTDESYEVIGLYNSTKPQEFSDKCYKIDITQYDEVKSFVAQNQSSLHNIILLNAAGVSYNSVAHKANIVDWSKVIDTNLNALFHLTSLLLPIMREDGYGRIINFASVVAQAGVVGTSAYAASKAALWGLSKALSAENASKNITVNNLNLGYFNIGMIEQVPSQILSDIIQKIPAKRLGAPDEILSTIKFIVDTAYLNGTSIDLNGGLF